MVMDKLLHLIVWGLFASTAFVLASARVQDNVEKKTFPMGPGVVIDRAGNRAYVMSPKGGMDAIALDQGRPIWSTKAATKPLDAAEGRVFAQAEPPDANVLPLVAIDAANGQPKHSRNVELKPGVRPSVFETPGPHGRFVARAKATGNPDEVIFAYHFTPPPVRGIPADADQRLLGGLRPKNARPAPGKAPAPAQAALAPNSDAFRINLASGETRRLEGAAAAVPPPAYATTTVVRLAGPERVRNVEGTQYLSADGRHVLVSQATGDDADRDKYTLSIHDRDTGNLVGRFKSHVPVLPFFVDGSRVIVETRPYERQTGAGVESQPRSLRAIDLNSGRELWSQPIRDSLYRGPTPP
jgi:outer membrane protein assembly factor BamB